MPLARQIKKHGIIPSRYVRWAYRLVPTNKDVWIGQITSNATFARYLTDEQRYLETELLSLQLQLATLKHQLSTGRSIGEIVDDELLDLGEAVRYAVARKAGMTDRAERLRHWADLDLESEPVYKSVLASFLN